MDRNLVLAVALGLQFRHFSETDYDAYAGVNSELPMIAETGNHTFILDGNVLVVIPDGLGDEQHFDLTKKD